MAPLLLTLQFPPQTVPLLAATRDHWRIENSLHWVLDVAFREDESRLQDHVARNMAVMRRLANSLLRRDTQTRMGIANKRPQGGTQFSLHGEESLLTLRLCGLPGAKSVLATPTKLVWSNPPSVFDQPKVSLMRLRIFNLVRCASPVAAVSERAQFPAPDVARHGLRPEHGIRSHARAP